LMTNVLADLALESEAATLLALRLARAYDNESDPAETAFRRIVTPAAKYWICKRGPTLTAEAMEVLGGNGYVEESLMPRLYREAPVNSIWEGSGNVMCLDVLRALGRSGAADAVLAELETARGGNADLDGHVAKLAGDLAQMAGKQTAGDESGGRRLVEALVLALQATLLLRHAPNVVAEAFCRSRLGGDGGRGLGTLPSGTDMRAIVERASPSLTAGKSG
jgi:putative acyl-CoA dehydrogenase